MKFSFLIAVFAILLICCNQDLKNKTISNSGKSNSELIAKGKYLVTILGCNDCHSPKIFTATGPIIDTNLLLSGYTQNHIPKYYDSVTAKNWLLFDFSGSLAKGPWGTSFAANITSDSTGIGLWSEEQFSNAIRKGYAKGINGGRKILPPMPWQNYTVMTDNDVKAIFYYLKSTKPIHNIVHPPIAP